MTREEAVKLLQVTRLMLLDGANQPISDLYYALGMAIEALEQIESNSEKPNNYEVKNYCDDCLYTDICDSKEFFYACTSKATISKMEQVEDEPQTETKTETQNSNLTFEKRTMRDCYNCKRYEAEGECIECHYEPKDEPQTVDKIYIDEDCDVWEYNGNGAWHRCDNYCVAGRPEQCIGCKKHICSGCEFQSAKEAWRKAQTDCAWK